MPKRVGKQLMGQGKVLPFQQSGEFFLRRGMTKMDRNNLLDAVVNYRHALALEPDNVEYKLALAEVLTEMNHFDESNRLLFSLFDGDKPAASECYFGLGCNFIGLQDYEHAHDCFEYYANIDPDGEFADEVYDMLDALDDEDLFREMFPLSEAFPQEAMEAANEGKSCLERNDYEGAVAVLEKAVEQYPKLHFLRNNLALSYFCARRFQDAAREVNHILAEDSHDIQAHCNLALFSNAVKDEAGIAREIAFIKKAYTEDADDLNRMAVTLLELGHFEDAKPLLYRLITFLPYDAGVVHRYAMCLYELGEYEQAIAQYDKLRKLDPDDSIARYYRGICRAAAAGAPKRANLLFAYQVPYEEVVSRIHRMNELAKVPYEQLQELWNTNEEFCSLMNWALQMPDLTVKRAMLALAASFQDARAEQLLRDFALDRNQPDEMKREVFGLLKRINAKEPYLGYIDGQLVQGRVSMFSGLSGDVPKCYQEVLEVAALGMNPRCTEESMNTAGRMWELYLRHLEGYPELKQPQIYAFAAALEYLACNRNGHKTTKTSVCGAYGISLLRLNTAIAKIMHVLENGKEEI